MKKYLILLLLISFCGGSSATITDEEIPSFSEAEKNQFFVWGPSFYSSIVDIYVYLDDEWIGGGTGTFISEDGLIVTNQHVTVGGDKFEVFTYGIFDKITEDFIDPETNLKIEPIEAILLGSSQCNDIAVLQINTDKKNTYLEWYGDNILPGLEIYTLGYPSVADGEIAVTTGVVSYVNSLGDSPWTAPGYNTFAHTSPIFSGNSGGPVVTAEGKLVGINYLTEDLIDESFPISKALNNHHIKDLVENYLLMGENYMDIGIGSTAIDLYWYLPETDDRNLTMHYIDQVQPGSSGEIAGLMKDSLLLEVGNNEIGFIQTGTDESSYELCNKIKEWQEGKSDLLNYTLYSCFDESFYKGYISKEVSTKVTELIDNPYKDSGFSIDDFNLVCSGYYQY